MPDYPIFDVHHHFGGASFGGQASGSWNIDEDCAARTRSMDHFGYRFAGLMPSLQYPRPNGHADTQQINNLMAEYRGRHRDRFPIAMGTVEPLFGVENGVAEIERLATELKLDAVVWHHRFQGCALVHSTMGPFLRKLAEHRLPAFVHIIAESGLEAPWGLEILAEQHPDVTFVALDAFSSGTNFRFLLGIAKRCPNVLVETAGLGGHGRPITDFVERFGSERVIFGTDLYLNPPSYYHSNSLYQVIEAPSLTDQDKRNILWENARKLFKLPEA